MQYVRSTFGSVSKTWNSINPATLSGAIDVIVVEQQDGTLACSPFHVRFGKFSLLRPSEKKVEFYVNNVRQDYAMKLGDGGEAFFVFETSAAVPEALQTSPLVSPSTSPQTRPSTPGSDLSTATGIPPLDLASESPRETTTKPLPILSPEHRAQLGLEASDQGLSQSLPDASADALSPGGDSILGPPIQLTRALASDDGLSKPLATDEIEPAPLRRTNSPPLLPKHEAVSRAMALSKRLLSSNIHATVNDQGDLKLDMTGYKSSEEEVARAEIVARQILSEEIEGNYDIGSLIGADENGNLWIYSSEEAKEAAARKAASAFGTISRVAMTSTDALSDPGYHSDDVQSAKSFDLEAAHDRESDSALGLSTPPDSPSRAATEPIRPEVSRNYAKTLRLTSDQLKALELKPGANPVSFTVNRATCQAYMYLWKHDVPIVVSDVDGTITKSDVLGHVMNTIGRDWTHLGVAKLYSDIVANGYNIFYLTSRSVGQADTTRTYLNGINQEGYRLPRGPVIMSPDRTIAALRREIYLRKPEVFKMACLRDIMGLFASRQSPFYAGFGNRLTDALSYRSVNIPSTRIFTINSNSEVSLDLLSLNKYKTGYQSMREIVDHYFPPVGTLVHEGGEDFTDFNYWRERPHEIDEFDMTDSEDEGLTRRPSHMQDDDEEDEDDEEREDDDDDDDDDIAEEGQLQDDDGVDGLGDPVPTKALSSRQAGDVLLAKTTVAQMDRDTEDEADFDEEDEIRKQIDAVDALDLSSSVHPSARFL